MASKQKNKGMTWDLFETLRNSMRFSVLKLEFSKEERMKKENFNI